MLPIEVSLLLDPARPTVEKPVNCSRLIRNRRRREMLLRYLRKSSRDPHYNYLKLDLI